MYYTFAHEDHVCMRKKNQTILYVTNPKIIMNPFS